MAAWLRSEALAPRRVRLDSGRLRELSRVLPEVPGTPQPLPGDEQRQRLFDAIARAILGAGAPVLLVSGLRALGRIEQIELDRPQPGSLRV